MNNLLLAAAIGDISGVPYEFKGRTKDYDAIDLLNPKNKYSDDTICTFACAEALIAGKDMAECLHRRGREDFYRGFGGRFAKWLMSPEIKPSYGSFGNGSGMRASSAGFLPQPNFAAYAASKSYVISFSRAMSYELKPLGISVTAICPGPVRTDFQRRATEGKETDFTDWRKNFVADPVKLARASLKASLKGKRMVSYPFSQKFLHLASKIIPISWILSFSGGLK